jgi:hypothetical protein
LDGATDGLDHPLEVIGGHTTGTKDVTVGKVLRGKVADGELGQHDLGSGSDDGLKLAVDDRPLGIDDGLVFLGVVPRKVLATVRSRYV